MMPQQAAVQPTHHFLLNLMQIANKLRVEGLCGPQLGGLIT